MFFVLLGLSFMLFYVFYFCVDCFNFFKNLVFGVLVSFECIVSF